jgi:hypothetical protein
MFYRNKKSRKYLAPVGRVLEVQLEGNFCLSVDLAPEVDELRNINADSDAAAAEEMYFEF